MNKFFRYTRRLILWFERPLPRDEWMIAFSMGKTAGRNELLRELPVNPFQPAQAPTQQIQPLTIRQRAQMQKLRATLVPMPQETEPSPVLPAVPFEFHLVDESWLNDVPVIEDGMETEQVPAISKLLHGGNK